MTTLVKQATKINRFNANLIVTFYLLNALIELKPASPTKSFILDQPNRRSNLTDDNPEDRKGSNLTEIALETDNQSNLVDEVCLR
jgi:hypothetical protein